MAWKQDLKQMSNSSLVPCGHCNLTSMIMSLPTEFGHIAVNSVHSMILY